MDLSGGEGKNKPLSTFQKVGDVAYGGVRGLGNVALSPINLIPDVGNLIKMGGNALRWGGSKITGNEPKYSPMYKEWLPNPLPEPSTGPGKAAELATSLLFPFAAKKAVVKGASTLASMNLPSNLSEFAKKIYKSDIAKYSKPSSSEFEDIVSSGAKGIEGLKQKAISAISEAKTTAKEDPELFNTKVLKSKITDLLKEKQVLPKKKKIGTQIVSIRPGVMQILPKEIPPIGIQKGVIQKNVLASVLGQSRQINKKSTLKDILDVIDNIDDILTAPVYNKEAAQEVANYAPKVGKQIRGIINEYAMNIAENTLPENKKNFVKIMNILNDEGGEIKRALKTDKGMNSLVKQSLAEGRKTTLVNLQRMDALLPDNKKFYKDALAKVFRKDIEAISRFYPSKPGIIMQGLESIPKAAALAIRAGSSPAGKGVGVVAKHAIPYSAAYQALRGVLPQTLQGGNK